MRFRCSCSRDRMVENLRSVYRREGEGLFDPGTRDLEVVCEYCKSRYRIEKAELDAAGERSH